MCEYSQCFQIKSWLVFVPFYLQYLVLSLDKKVRCKWPSFFLVALKDKADFINKYPEETKRTGSEYDQILPDMSANMVKKRTVLFFVKLC